MPVVTTGLARITIDVPGRRLDLALPDAVPLVDLLPAVLRNVGGDAVDLAAAPGGWVLRWADGGSLDLIKTLRDQGVRDGAALFLGRVDDGWPEPEYDDIGEAVAALGSRRGPEWDARATRLTCVILGASADLAGVVAVARTGRPWPATGLVALAIATALVIGATVLARAFRRPDAGALAGALALPYALVGGLALGHGERIGPVSVLLAGVCVTAYAGLVAFGVGPPLRLPIAGLVAGTAAMISAPIAAATSETGAAAVVLGVLALATGLAPIAAIALARLPRDTSGGRDRLLRAVVRADDALGGLLLGAAFVAIATSCVLAFEGGTAADLLVVACAVGFALRARAYPALDLRAVALLGGVGTAVPLVAVFVTTGHPPVVTLAAAVALGLAALVAVAVATDGPWSPYLGRAGDALEVISIAAVLPLVAIVLGLYTKLRGISF